MTITRVDAEQILDRRIGAFLAEAGMNALQDGINPWLTDPLRWALYMLGIESASVVAVTDADLSAIVRSQVDALLDLAELKALEAILTNFTGVDTRVGQVEEDRASLGVQIRQIADRKRKHIASVYADLLAHPLEQVSSTSVRLVSL